MQRRHIGRIGRVLLAATACLAGTYAFGQATDASSGGRLAAAARAAKSQFRPLTAADLDAAKEALVAAVGKLDQRLGTAGDNGNSWRKYLRWDDLQGQLQTTGPLDANVLNAIYGKLTAGNEGLEQVWFVDVREALREYLELAGAVGSTTLKAAYEERLEGLAKQLETYAARPTHDVAEEIGASLAWLASARQAPELIQAIRAEFARPNWYGEVTGEVVAAGIDSTVDRTEPVDDVILGTTIHGMGRTEGETKAVLVPDPSLGVFDAVLLAVNRSQNAGRNRSVCIYSDGTTGISAVKRFWFDAEGLHAYPAVARAEARTNIHGIQSDRGRQFVERIAWNKAGQSQGEAEYIASRHAEQRASRRVDDEAADSLAKAKADYERKVRKPLGDRNVFPQQLGFNTTSEAIHVVGLQAGMGQLGAPAAPLSLTERSEISVRMHESAVNNMATTVLAGMILHEAGFQSAVTEILGRVPERLKPDEEKDPWTVVFARKQPITVAFADSGFTIVIRGRQFYKGERAYPGMNITVSYKFVKTDQGWKAVRQGDVQIYPPDFVPGGGKQLSVRQQTIRSMLQRRMAKVFDPEMVPEGFTMSGKWEAAGRFAPVEMAARDGWLLIGWRRTTVPPKAVPKSATTAAAQ